MANERDFNKPEGCVTESKTSALFERRYNATNFRIIFRMNWVVLITITSISACQFVGSAAERQVSNLHEKNCELCSIRSERRSMTSNKTLRSPARLIEDPVLTPQDIVSRLEIAAVLRDNLVTMLGRILLLCFNDEVRVPLKQIHDAVRNQRIAVYEFLPILPKLRNKLPQQQLYKLLQILERVDNRFISEYASLSINIFPNINDVLNQVPHTDMLLGIDQEVIESISLDEQKTSAVLLSLTKSIDFLLEAARNDERTLDLRTVSAILLNYPIFDLTDPEVYSAIRFIAQRLKKRSDPEDILLQYLGPNLENTGKLLKIVLERLEADELSSEITREATSILLQNFNAESYPPTPGWKNNLRKLLLIANDYYPVNVAAAAEYLHDRLEDSHLRALDIDFYGRGDHALFQVLSRLRRRPDMQHLKKPLSLLEPFVSQKMANDAVYDYTEPVTFYEVTNYLNSLDTPCLQENISDAMASLHPYLSDNLPWTYAFGARRVSDDPRELILSSFVRLRNIPLNALQMKSIDNFIYRSHMNGLTRKRGLLYDSGIIFQREDSINVEVDLFSLLTRIPNAFKSEKFAPMLNFMSKPNILDIFSFEFNKFEHDTPRNLLLAMLERALTLPFVKSDELLTRALQNAHDYLKEPLLINLYVPEDLQELLKYLPHIDSDPRYLPIKILFKKENFSYLSSTFILTDIHTPIEKLLYLLQTVGLKTAEPKLSEALIFAVNNINEPPLPIETFDRSDFVYLVQQLLSRDETLQNEILKSEAYMNVNDWNISISGTPENILVRTLSYPVDYISTDATLSDLVKRAKSILEEETLINNQIIKNQMLETMLEYLPINTYVKPVILLLKKANLMTLVPNLNLSMLETIPEREALVILLKNLTGSDVIRSEKLLLRRIRTALNYLDDSNRNDRQNPIFAYLIQSLQDPSNAVYQPLLQKISELDNVIVSSDERQAWLQNYLQRIIDKNKSKNLTKAASMILKEITYDDSLDEMARASKKRIKKAVSILPVDPIVEPLRKLLSPDWAYSILPEEIRNSNSLEREELLLAILYYAKQRTDIVNNVPLMNAIFKIEKSLKGWKMNIQPLRDTVSTMKAAVYNPVKKLLTATGLNKMKVSVPSDRSAKISLLGLLRRLISHPIIKENNNIVDLLSAVRQDVFTLGVEKDLLTVLDDVGIPYLDELAPIRLYLYRKDIDEKLVRDVFSVTNPRKRFYTLLRILQRQEQRNDTQFHNALVTLTNIPLTEGPAGTQVSDIQDVVNGIPSSARYLFKPIEHLFNIDTLSRLTTDDEIVTSNTPLAVLVSKLMSLPEVKGNSTIMKKLKKLQSNVELLNYPIVTGFELRPLLQVLEHVQQINVDYLNSILTFEILTYLNPENFLDTSDDNIEILQIIVEYLLEDGPAFMDYTMQKHLNSFKRVLELTVGFNKSSKRDLTTDDWEKMLNLIPHQKEFIPIKIFLRTKEIFKYVKYENTDWKMFTSPAKKLLYLLSLLNENDIQNKNVYQSAIKLQRHLQERYYFITEQDVEDMHRTLAKLGLKHDLVPLKIFLTHDNMIKYLPTGFKYASYKSPIDALAAVLDILLQSSSLKRKEILHDTMTYVRRALYERTSAVRRSFRRIIESSQLSSKDLELVRLLNTSLPEANKFLDPDKLAKFLPESFTFDNQPTFKAKMLHLLRQLLKMDTDIQLELKRFVQEIELYPDVPDIAEDDLVPLLNMIPVEGIPRVEDIKRYLKPTTLIKFLPGNFDIKRVSSTKKTLRDVLSLLRDTLGSEKSNKLNRALNMLIIELSKPTSNIIPYEPIVDRNDIRSIIKEIPFNQYKQLEPLKARMTTKNVLSSLPLNFQLIDHKTMKSRVLAVLGELSKSKNFRSSLHSINFAERVVDRMPDLPVANDTEIENLLLILPLNVFNMKRAIENCKVANLMPYLPIDFNLGDLKTRKMKITKILHYCKLANSMDMSTQQALTNAEEFLQVTADVDATRDHVETLIRAIPCTHFTSIKPLLRFLLKKDISPFLPWNFGVYKKSRAFKDRILDLLTALRNVKELQTDEMFSALDSLETNTKSLPEEISIPQDTIKALGDLDIVSSSSCSQYRDFVLKSENLIQILPPNFQFQRETWITGHTEWVRIIRLSSLFLRKVIDGSMKQPFEDCRSDVYTYEKKQLFDHLSEGLNKDLFRVLVPLRLYTLGHANDMIAPIESIYRTYPYGSTFSMLRVMMRELILRPELIKSKSLIGNMEVFLHDYLMVVVKEYFLNSNEKYTETLSSYDISQAIGEIPSNRQYDDLRNLMQCQTIQTKMLNETLQSEDMPKQLIFDMLKIAEKEDIDDAIRLIIKTLKPHVVNNIHVEEVELVLKQLRDYRYHSSKIDCLRRYLVLWGLAHVLGEDFSTKYRFYKDRLFAINNEMLTKTTDFSPECRAASEYLNNVLNDKIKIERVVPRSIDDIDAQSLLFALPKTKNERIIRGIIKFFSIPDLLRKLRLPKDPFEYVTKGRLLRAIMDLGQELESVQRDSLQQEALEYFRDKIITGDSSAQPIELKRYARNSNVDVDMYGVMQAIDYSRINEADAVEVALFFERKYNNLVHAVGFDHMAYATRGAYLKALFEHLVNVSQVPDNVKQRIALLIPAIKLNDTGEESVDLNSDIAYDEAPIMRIFGESRRVQSAKPVTRLGTEMVSDTFQEKKESLDTDIDKMLESITSSEEEYLDSIIGRSVYKDKTRIVIDAPVHHHDIGQQKLNPEQARRMNKQADNRRRTQGSKNDRSTKKVLLDDAFVPFIKDLKYIIVKKVRRKPKNDEHWQIQSIASDHLKKNGNNLSTFEKQIVKSPSIISQKLLSNEQPKKSRHVTRDYKSVILELPVQPNANSDTKYDDFDKNPSISRRLNNRLDENNSPLDEEIEQVDSDKTSKTVKKDLSNMKNRNGRRSTK